MRKLISEEIKNVEMTGHDSCDEDETTEDYIYLDCMRKLSKEQMERFPRLVIEGMVCQSYYISRFEKCNGCTVAISGCEKVFDTGCN